MRDSGNEGCGWVLPLTYCRPRRGHWLRFFKLLETINCILEFCLTGTVRHESRQLQVWLWLGLGLRHLQWSLFFEAILPMLYCLSSIECSPLCSVCLQECQSTELWLRPDAWEGCWMLETLSCQGDSISCHFTRNKFEQLYPIFGFSISPSILQHSHSACHRVWEKMRNVASDFTSSSRQPLKYASVIGHGIVAGNISC